MIPLGILGNRRGGGGGTPAMELISSTILASNQTSVTFSSIASTYKHLQIRYTGQVFEATPINTLRMYVNGDTGSTWSKHRLYGNGSSVASNGQASTQFDMDLMLIPDDYGTYNNQFGAGIIDILDYANTSKYKTVRAFGGNPYAGTYKSINLHSGAWQNTAAITSITLQTSGGASYPLKTASRFSLYGIKG